MGDIADRLSTAARQGKADETGPLLRQVSPEVSQFIDKFDYEASH